MRQFLALSDRLNRVLMVAAAFWAFILAVAITIDVTGRGLFSAPLTGTLEIVVNSIVVIAFLQIGFAVRSRSMLRADFLLQVMPRRLRRGLDVLGLLAGAAVFGLLAYAILDPLTSALATGEYEGEGALRVPTWPIYGVIAFGAGLACLNYLVLAFLALREEPV